MTLSDWAQKARYFKSLDRKRDWAILNQRSCDVHTCNRKPVRYIGSRRLSWLYFCSKHTSECEAINRYLSEHERAKFPSGPSFREHQINQFKKANKPAGGALCQPQK